MPKKTDLDFSQNDALSQIPKISPVQDIFGWSIPVEQIPLPSGGVIYPQNNPLHGRETLQIKAMTAQEEDILMSRALIKEGTVISHLIKSCLIDKTINVGELLAGDRNSLLVAIRITGYGAVYEAAASCPSCKHEDTYDFDLSSIGIKNLGAAPDAPGKNEFSFKLPVTKKVVTFKLLTVRDEEEAAQVREKMQKLFPDTKVEGTITKQLENQILSVDGHYEKPSISAFIKAMPALDSKTLRNYMVSIEPGLDMKVDFTCKSCSVETKVGLPAGAAFFWPGT